MRRLIIVPVAAALATALTQMPVGAASLPTDVTVRVYDAVALSIDDLRAAAQTAGAIFSRAGLEVGWRFCDTERDPVSPSSDGCAEPLQPAEMSVRIVSAPAKAKRGSFAYSHVDTAQRSGVLSTLFVDRIFAAAARVGRDRRVLLGRVMAHEIGHLLLGTSAHTRHGLMRARWSDQTLRRDVADDWIFSADDQARMAAGLKTRERKTLEVAGVSPFSGSAIQ